MSSYLAIINFLQNFGKLFRFGSFSKTFLKVSNASLSFNETYLRRSILAVYIWSILVKSKQGELLLNSSASD